MKIQNVESSLKRGISWNIQNVSASFFFFTIIVTFVSAKIKKPRERSKVVRKPPSPFTSSNENYFVIKLAM